MISKILIQNNVLSWKLWINTYNCKPMFLNNEEFYFKNGFHCKSFFFLMCQEWSDSRDPRQPNLIEMSLNKTKHVSFDSNRNPSHDSSACFESNDQQRLKKMFNFFANANSRWWFFPFLLLLIGETSISWLYS